MFQKSAMLGLCLAIFLGACAPEIPLTDRIMRIQMKLNPVIQSLTTQEIPLVLWDNPNINARAFQGKVYLNSGILKLSYSQIAFLLAHEESHILFKHNFLSLEEAQAQADCLATWILLQANLRVPMVWPEEVNFSPTREANILKAWKAFLGKKIKDPLKACR